MSKTSVSTLRKAIRQELITYLGAGTINHEKYADTFDYEGLNIENFDQLKKLHFVLAPDVVNYVDRIPEWIRRIKSVTREQTETVRGEIRGSIDWRETRQARAAAGYNDPTLFVVRDSEVAYDIPENRVVKKLLAVIAEPLTNDVEAIDQEWRSMWNDQDIVDLQQLLAQNIHLDALPEPERISLSERDLTTARRSRHRLYTESHRLYRLYDDLLNNRFENERVRELLSETLIAPSADHKVFELFCVFGVIRRLRRRHPELELRRIDTGTDVLARLKDDERRIEVYYDQSGPLEFFESYPSPKELQSPKIPEMVRRHAEALDAHERAVDTFLDADTAGSFYSGRPDFLILQYSLNKDEQDRGILTDVIIGEVKYTRIQSTFSTGLRELFEYLYFARENQQYLFGNDTSDINVTGLLCTDGVETEVESVESISHLTPAKLGFDLT
ncbi:hypothetical protein [Haloarcula sebkhae]|uniref:Uncharacterized protein n=2 Tax=Haloarcula sebkhae TaxID=932660 RepID=A0ACC6VQC3_9EURY|nr:hypothetical protein [Haloarcula sebkhae]GGK64686.1 hypothetical protein GCM10009067_16420 [Haloarcula sebkhae]